MAVDAQVLSASSTAATAAASLSSSRLQQQCADLHRAINLAAACCTLLQSTWRHLQLLPKLYDVQDRRPF